MWYVNQSEELPTTTNKQNEEQDEAKMIMSKKKELFQVEMRRDKRQEIISRKRRDMTSRNSQFQQNTYNSTQVDVEKSYEQQNETQKNPQSAEQTRSPQFSMPTVPLVRNQTNESLQTQQTMISRIMNLNFQSISPDMHLQFEKVIETPANPEDLMIALLCLRTLTSEKKIFQADLNLNLAEKLLQHLNRLEQFPYLVYESVQLLSIISGGTREQVNSIINAGGITFIKNSFNNYIDYMEIQEQMVEIIGNIAADLSSSRDLVMKSDILPMLIQSPHSSDLYQSTLLWAMANICTMKDYCAYADLSIMLPILKQSVFRFQNDKQVLGDCFLSLYVLAKQAKRMDEQAEFCSEEIRQCLMVGFCHQITSVREYALKVIAALGEKNKSSICISFIVRNKLQEVLLDELNYPHMMSKKEQKQITLQAQIMENTDAARLLDSQQSSSAKQFQEVNAKKSSKISRKVAVTSLYSLMRQNESMINYFLENYNILSILIKALKNEPYDYNMLEILYCLEAIFAVKKTSIIDNLFLGTQLFDVLNSILDFELTDLLQVGLQFIFDILNELKELEDSNKMIDNMLEYPAFTLSQAITQIQDSGILKKIIQFQTSKNSSIFEISMDILDKFFPDN